MNPAERSASTASVEAIVLTHDAQRALDACLTAIRAQTWQPSKVVVVDCGSEPPACVPRGVVLRRLQENLGPAGGHAEGLAAFAAGSHTHAWVMDDDCRPATDCLQRLMEAQREGDALLHPRVIDAQGTTVTSPGWFGLVISKEVVRDVGLPNAELFWWIEDTEYLQHRIGRAGYPTHVVQSAMVQHCALRRGRRKPAWKYYYEARNSFWYRLHVHRSNVVLRLWRATTRPAARILLIEDHKLSKAHMLLLGVSDGIRGRLGRRFVPPPSNPDRR